MAPRRRRIPLWLAVPAVFGGFVALVAAVVVASVNVDDECARAERLMASFQGDPRVLFEAQARLKLLLVTHPFSARGWAAASHLARVAGDPGEGGTWAPSVLAMSHDCARRAIHWAPGADDGHLAEGWTYACANDWLLAEAEARQAEVLAPADPRVRVLVGTVDAAQHRPAEAIAGFRSAIADARADSVLRADAEERLAVLCAVLTLDTNADSAWASALSLSPRATRPRGRHVRWLTSRGRHDEAIAAAESLVALADRPETRAVRAAALVGKGVWWIEARRQPAEALQEFERADADQPDDSGIWYNIALAHVGLFRESASPAERDAARAAVARARRLAPRDADVRELATMVDQLGNAPASAR